MAYQHYPITGIKVKEGDPIPCRCDLRKFLDEKPIQLSLWIRAMLKFYALPYTDKFSYFRMAAIHGYPLSLTWDKAPLRPGEFELTVIRKDTYCRHNDVTFPSWHRPYMLYYEQRMHDLMMEVINQDLEFDSDDVKKQWMHEAEQWRLPYWDWAISTGPGAKEPFPWLFKKKSISVRTPNGPDTEIPENPFWRYQLKVDGKPMKMGDPSMGIYAIGDDVDDDEILPWSQCSGTSRYGITRPDKMKGEISDEMSQGINNHELVEKRLGKYLIEKGKPMRGDSKIPAPDNLTIRGIVYRILTTIPNYKYFACTRFIGDDPQDWTAYLGVEMIHNSVHNMIGGLIQTPNEGQKGSAGLGHMIDTAVAAFDPIFMIHHAQVIQPRSIWQIFNPDSWWTGPPEGTDPDNWYDGPDTELLPFSMNVEGKKHTGNSVRNWTDYGYNYDMLADSNGKTLDQEAVKQWVDRYYAPFEMEIVKKAPELLVPPKELPTDGVPLPEPNWDELKSEVMQIASVDSGEREIPDYLLNIVYDRYALSGFAYTIHVFLGKITDEEFQNYTGDITDDKRYVGSIFSFSMPIRAKNGDSCSNCLTQADAGVFSCGQLPLTEKLMELALDRGVQDIWGIDRGYVERFLQANLDWKAVTPSGRQLTIQDLPGTKFLVVGGKAKYYDKLGKMAEFYDYEQIPAATKNLNGGATDEADFENPLKGLKSIMERQGT